MKLILTLCCGCLLVHAAIAFTIDQGRTIDVPNHGCASLPFNRHADGAYEVHLSFLYQIPFQFDISVSNGSIIPAMDRSIEKLHVVVSSDAVETPSGPVPIDQAVITVCGTSTAVYVDGTAPLSAPVTVSVNKLVCGLPDKAIAPMVFGLALCCVSTMASMVMLRRSPHPKSD
ncbi:hypothetical protein J8273_4336 [Carpediemonas membranifera]|uniref:Uncharacterized protein n=1 Tax=Carpediemonas membranifera TaxID=201153 RepID=A0A8J6B4M7_9EUKA|nr:hypothetical protein J8273_4336 [Carpediemonas membranifera]|eukprot:KAG9394234.1 hypothetical protein J8273_4336 [Carpediemonas membranifera]